MLQRRRRSPGHKGVTAPPSIATAVRYRPPDCRDRRLRGCSSAGRAAALQAVGRGFESLHLHSQAKTTFSLIGERFCAPLSTRGKRRCSNPFLNWENVQIRSALPSSRSGSGQISSVARTPPASSPSRLWRFELSRRDPGRRTHAVRPHRRPRRRQAPTIPFHPRPVRTPPSRPNRSRAASVLRAVP